MIPFALGAFVLLGGLFFVALPAAAWFEARERARARGSNVPSAAFVVAAAWKPFTQRDAVPDGADPLLHRAAPAMTFAAALLPLAVIPFGARYAFGEAHVALVLADLDWGVLLVPMAGLLGVVAGLTAGFARDDPGSRLGALRTAGIVCAVEAALLVTLGGMLLWAGSLHLPDVVALQDRSLHAIAWLCALPGAEAVVAELSWVRIPAWGIVMQPIGFALFLLCAHARAQHSSLQAASASGLAGGWDGSPGGASLALHRTADLVRLWVLAALGTVFFLGGGALPYVTQEAITATIAAVLGDGFANGLCLVLHVGVFAVKTAFLAALLLVWRHGAAPSRVHRMESLGWERLLPLACLHLAAVAFAWWSLGAQAVPTLYGIGS